MEEQILEERLIEIESAIAIQEKTIDELNQVVIEQGRQIDRLIKQNLYLAELLKNAGYEVVRTAVVPDEQAQIEAFYAVQKNK